MVSAQVKRLFTWKRYYDFRAGGVGGYDAGLSGAICALEASDRREQFATFLDMLEETLMALSVLEDTEGDDGVDEVYSNYNHNMAHGGRMSPSSNASTMVARSVADSIARKLAAKTTQDAVEAVGLVQALGAVLVDMSIEAPSFKVNVGYMPSTYNEIPLEKNDLVTLFGLIDDRVGYGLNRRTNELGFVPLAHIDQHTVYQRPPDSYRPNPKRLSSRQLGLRQPGHSLNTNVIQRMAIANPNGHFRQGSTTNVGRQDVPAPPTDEQLLEVLRTAGQAGSAGSGGSSGDGGVPNATRKASVNSSINAGIADGKRYSIGQTIHVPAGYAPSAQRAGVQAAYGRAASPYTGHQQPAVGQSREERQYRRAGMASPIPGDYGRLPPNPNHPKFSDQGTPTYYHPGQTKGRIENDGRQEGRYAEGMYEEPLSEVSGVADAGRKHSAGGRVHAASPVPHQFGAPPVHGGYASPVPHRYGREERDPRYGGFGVPQNRARSKSNVGGYPDPNVPVHKHQRSQSTGSILSAESEGPYELPPERPEMPQRVVQHGQYPPPPQGRPGVGVKHMQHRLPYSRVGQLSPIPASPSTPTSPIGSTPSSHTSPGAGPSESIPPIPGQQPIRYNLESLGPIARPCQIPMQTLSPTGPVPPPPTRTSPTSLTSSSPPRSAKSPIFSTSSKSNTGTPATPATPRTLDYDEDGEEDVDEEEVGSVKSPALSAVLPQRVPAGRDEGSGKAYELGPAGLRHSRPDSDEVVIIEDGSRWSAESDRPEIKGKRGSDDVEVR
ncbi:hypothetical protein HK097_002459 [Rhizophlyctis rosea]|uniref:SH3 domain-containing protein n=1 Tax=Rhizophlyctis rosea TaxID=64517 RepID=A0AAD5S4S7_9FUNG|nr:hypothetical protein HK097_002459 [Rhizophlyctis rosea]